MQAQTIEEVITMLDEVIRQCKATQNPLGYFAALYRRVTVRIRDGIAKGEFQDNARMERLDVIFANRYLEAWTQYQTGQQPTASCQCAFTAASDPNLIVLQHLLVGMNVHIGLDLGIAAAQAAPGDQIQGLRDDFNQINRVLASLVEKVEADLTEVWPFLGWVLRVTRRVDNFMVDFSMELAREGAWRFAVQLAGLPASQQAAAIAVRDGKVAKVGEKVVNPGRWTAWLLSWVRKGEKGSVADKIAALEV